jgi:hypothetical protein
MTKQEIIEMAKQAGGRIADLPNGDVWLFDDDFQLESFAKLIEERVKQTLTEETV